MPVITIASSLGSYQADFHADLGFFSTLKDLPRAYFLFDARVWELYGPQLAAFVDPERLLLVPIHEDEKNLTRVEKIYSALMEKGIRRNFTLVAVGGGILQDLVGFAASTLFRGVPWTFVPTTLLAQADSCIGGKTSLNFGRHKNLLGTFWPPRQIHVSPVFLQTLAEDDYFSGLGEVLKLHLIGGAADMAWFEAHQAALHRREVAEVLQATLRALEIKKSYIESDEFDGDARLLLNFGHCFGHAIESTSDFRIPHGQAVVAGMLLANTVSVHRGLLSPEAAAPVRATLQHCLVVPPRAAELEPAALAAAMGKDKKRTGAGLAAILLHDHDHLAQVQDLSPEEVVQAVDATAFS